MTIQELIDRLERIKDKSGNLTVVLNCNTTKITVEADLGDDGHGNDMQYLYIDENKETTD